MKVRLLTRDGRGVIDTRDSLLSIPPFVILPEGIQWGQRVFFLDPATRENYRPEYREGLLWYAPMLANGDPIFDYEGVGADFLRPREESKGDP